MSARAPRPRVAIVGRPNVGKSTIFNRMIGRRRSITLDTPGVTRDPIEVDTNLGGLPVTLVDTGGLGGEAEIALADAVHRHTVQALGSADVLVVIFDSRAGVTAYDEETVRLVEASGVPALYVANKAEGPAQELEALSFCSLGIDPPLCVSAEHAMGLGELRRAIVANLAERGFGKSGETADATTQEDDTAPGQSGAPDPGEEASNEETSADAERDGAEAIRAARAARPCRVAIVGRPNVGKSSFVNRLADRELALVDDTPGTTRDTLDLAFERDGREYIMVDTAGLRRPSKVDRGVEELSVRRSLGAINDADVVLLLIEPTEGLTDQDARIANKAWDEGRALVVGVNKIDLVPDAKARRALLEETIRRAPTLRQALHVVLSVQSGEGIDDSFNAIDAARAAHDRKIETGVVNAVLAETAERRQPPIVGRGRLRMLYATQTGYRPPTLTVFANRFKVPTEYGRFLERVLRERVPLEGTPVRIRWVRRDSHGGRD